MLKRESTSLQAIKLKSEMRLSEEKKLVDRNRNLLVLIMQYLSSSGFHSTTSSLQSEAGISLSKFTVADNIDLAYILQEFEAYSEIKFGRKPVLVRRSNNPSNDEGGTTSSPNLISHKKKSMVAYEPPVAPPSNNNNNEGPHNHSNNGEEITKKKIPTPSVSYVAPEPSPAFCLTGSTIVSSTDTNASKSAKAEAANEKFINSFLKPLPYELNSEMRELAMMISRDIYQQNPQVYWDDIIELDNAKNILKEAVVMPLKYPELFTGLLSPWKGVLLAGPPGTGKTMLAKAVATECKTTFFNISASSIVSKYRGDSEKLVRILFDLARYHAPSTIFLDEIDALMGQRGSGQSEHEASRRMKTELLIQLDGLSKSNELVFLLAASNLPWDLDAALLRRLEKRILVPLPCLTARHALFKKLLSQSSISPSIDYNNMALVTEGYSGSDIKLLCKEAAMRPLRRLMKKLEEVQLNNNEEAILSEISNEDLQGALEVTKPSSHTKTDRYTEWQEEFGSRSISSPESCSSPFNCDSPNVIFYTSSKKITSNIEEADVKVASKTIETEDKLPNCKEQDKKEDIIPNDEEMIRLSRTASDLREPSVKRERRRTSGNADNRNTISMSTLVKTNLEIMTSLSISNPYYRRVEDNKTKLLIRKSYAVYGIKVVLGNKREYVIERRYSEFIILRREVEKTLIEICGKSVAFMIPSLPSKTLLLFRNNLSSSFLKERGKSLNLFLRDLITCICSIMPDFMDKPDQLCDCFRILFIFTRFLGMTFKDHSTIKVTTLSFNTILKQLEQFSKIMCLDNHSLAS